MINIGRKYKIHNMEDKNKELENVRKQIEELRLKEKNLVKEVLLADISQYKKFEKTFVRLIPKDSVTNHTIYMYVNDVENDVGHICFSGTVICVDNGNYDLLKKDYIYIYEYNIEPITVLD
jgi:hypothetical protein